MRYVTATGYYATGSSAVTDLLEEYEGVKSLGSNFECRIAHDMYGLSDLEYYLVDNNHRHNSSVAIKEFYRLMRFYGLDSRIRLENYPQYVGEDFGKYVDQYIHELAPRQYSGGSHVDIYRKTDVEIILLKLLNRIHRKFNKVHFTVDDSSYAKHKQTPLERARSKETTYITYPRELFIDATKRFTRNLFSRYYDDSYQYLLIDQLIPATNTMRYVRYFDDVKVISVDRDPRDIFYLEKHYWKGGVVPVEPKGFSEWFLATRAHRAYEQDNPSVVLRIQFEDLVLKYDETVARIESFLGLNAEHHTKKMTVFNPQISRKNIGKWENDSSEAENIRYIEEHLSEYCYRI